MADIQVANTDANLSGNTLVTEEEDYTITGLHTFARSATGLIVSTKAVIGSVEITGEWTGSLVGAQLGGLGILASHDSASAGNSMDVAYNAVAGSGNNSEYMISSEEASKIVLSNGIKFQVAGTGTAGDTISFTDALSITSAGNIALSGTITAGTWEGTDIGVAHGGTGVSTLTDGGVLLGSGTGAITAMSVLTDGQMIVGDGSGDPVAESGATLRTSIGVGTGDSPQFTGLTISGTGVSSLDVGGGINVGTGNVSLVGTDGKISGPLSSTIIDDLSGANLISLNASNISSGTLANARLPTNVDLGGTLDVTGRLLVDSVGPSAIGQAVSGTTSLVLGGAFTSDGSSNYAYKVNVAGSLTGAAGDTARLALFRVGGTGVTTAAASETTTLVTSAFISEPSLTKGSGSTVTNATALYIDAAPSGATNNYALWVDAGATKLDGTLGVGGATTLDSTLGVGQSSPDGTVHIETGSAGSISFQGASDDLIVENSTHGGITVATPAASEGSLMFLGPTTGDLGIIAYSQASPGFQFHVANAEKARLTPTGLGVAVNDPDVALDVSGGENKLDIFRITQRLSGAAAYGLQIGLDPSPGDPVFCRVVNDTATESFRMQRSSGLVAFSNGVSFNPGETTAANTLDDYEEGVFTPVLTGTTSASGVGYDTQTGIYTKVGNRVTFNITINLSSKGTIAGYLKITGLPFTNGVSQNGITTTKAANVVMGDYFKAWAPVYGSSAFMYLFMVKENVDTGTTQMDTDEITNNTEFEITGSYSV